MRIENILQASYWFTTPTSDLSPLVNGLLVGLAGLWCILHVVWGRMGWRRWVNIVAGLLFASSVFARVVNIPILELRGWWLLSILAILLSYVGSWLILLLRLLFIWVIKPLANKLTHPIATLALATAVITGTFGWAAWTGWTLRTHGVTGSDPYAYAQMGVDLVTKGTVYHAFPLVRITHDLSIDAPMVNSYPVTHVGYRLPTDVRRISTTVWPPGYAVITGLAYLLMGEVGLYLVTPFVGLLSLIVIGMLTYLLVGIFKIGRWTLALREPEIGQLSDPMPHHEWNLPDPTQLLGAAVAIFISATSYQQVEWQMTPMADLAAQLVSLLALLLAFNAERTSHIEQKQAAQAETQRGRNRKPPTPLFKLRSLHLALLSGLCLGLAFSIRYTQVLIAPALAIALWQRNKPILSFRRVLICAISAFIAIIPLLIYHTTAFGAPWHTGSDELSNFSISRFPETVERFFGELNSHREFGYLWLLMLIGSLVLAWRNIRHFAALVFYVLPLLILHLFYDYLRPRDLLSIFPIGAALTALGFVTLYSLRWRVLRIAAVLLVATLLLGRSSQTLALPVTRAFGAFGYLVTEQRASFEHIRLNTPANAIIACSLNSGAVDLHSQRQTVRPASWSAPELITFMRAVKAEGHPVYLLFDGDELKGTIDTLQFNFRLTEIRRFDIPYYFYGGGSENRKVPLYRLD